jgi:hypothetical protein
VAPDARSGYRPTGLEAAGMELASDMGFPPLLETKPNYHPFFKDVKFFEHGFYLKIKTGLYMGHSQIRIFPFEPASRFIPFQFFF